MPACSCTCLLKLSHQDLYNFIIIIIIIISVIINVILIIRLKFQEVWTLTARTSCHTDVDTPTTVFFPFSLIKQAPPKLLSKYPPTPKNHLLPRWIIVPRTEAQSVTKRMRRAGGAVAAFEANPNTDFCPKLGHHSAACTPDVLNLAFLARTATSWVPDNSTVLSEPAHKTASSPFTLIFGSSLTCNTYLTVQIKRGSYH